jgi:hypothetical protein
MRTHFLDRDRSGQLRMGRHHQGSASPTRLAVVKGPCRGLVLRERIRIRAIPGIRPGGQPTPAAAAAWSARHGGLTGIPAGAGARSAAAAPAAAAAAAQQWSPARSPSMSSRIRPDMAGRQRQPVPVTHPAHPLPSAWTPARLTPIRAHHAACARFRNEPRCINVQTDQPLADGVRLRSRRRRGGGLLPALVAPFAGQRKPPCRARTVKYSPG